MGRTLLGFLYPKQPPCRWGTYRFTVSAGLCELSAGLSEEDARSAVWVALAGWWGRARPRAVWVVGEVVEGGGHGEALAGLAGSEVVKLLSLA